MEHARWDLLEHAVAEANRWVQEVMEGIGDTRPHRGYSALRSVLHAVRDYLPFDDGMKFAAQLPPVVRGLYLDGWNHRQGPAKERLREEFLARVAERMVQVADLRPDRAAQAVFALLSRRIGPGKMRDVLTLTQDPMKGFWPGPEAEAHSPLSEDVQEARVEKAKQEIRTAIERAKLENVPKEELPAMSSRRRARPRARPAARNGKDGSINVFDKSVQKTNLWLRDLLAILKGDDPRCAFLTLQAVLHTLRDRLTTDEAFQLGTQLPMILRGFYFEGWDPGRAQTKDRTKDRFLHHIDEKLAGEPDILGEPAARAVFTLVSRRVTEGEIEDVRGSLPKHLRELWPALRPASSQETLAGKPVPREPVNARRHGRARARKTRKEIRSAIARARAEGVPERDLPVLISRRAVRKTASRKRRVKRPFPKWYAREQKEEFPEGEGGPPSL